MVEDQDGLEPSLSVHVELSTIVVPDNAELDASDISVFPKAINCPGVEPFHARFSLSSFALEESPLFFPKS